MYWLYTCLIASLLLLFPQYFSAGKQFNLEHFLASLFFMGIAVAVGFKTEMVKDIKNVGQTSVWQNKRDSDCPFFYANKMPAFFKTGIEN